MKGARHSSSPRGRHRARNRVTMIVAAAIVSASTLSLWATRAPSTSVCAFSPSLPSPGNAVVVARHRPAGRGGPFPLPRSRLCAETASESPDTKSDASPDAPNDALPTPDDMRLREMQSELKERNVSYADCFDRESLVKRLVEARNGLVKPAPEPATAPEPAATREGSSRSSPPAEDAELLDEAADADASSEEFDRESTLTELRALRVKELKIRLSEFKVRWGTMIEKEEMVQALCQAMEDRFERSKTFSRSGELVPGTVADVDERTLIEELGWTESDVNAGVATAAKGGASDGSEPSPHAPILLDVYATWCGPCQMIAPFLVAAAEELGPAARVVKLDSDKHPRISSVLKVGGLPTLIKFDGGDVSREVDRIEGALTKDQIVDFVNGNLKR